MGEICVYTVLKPAVMLQTTTENTRDPLGKGVQGGGNGGVAEIVVWPETEKEVRLTERVTFFGPLDPGDRVSVRSPGGGGWGPPLERDPEQVARDVRDELLTVEQAAELYGVVVRPDWTVDVEATRERRRAQRGDAD